MVIGTSHDTSKEPDHRSSFRIVADVLRAARREDTKSCLFRQANLNHTRGERYLAFCADRDLVEVRDDGYDVTREGQEYLSDWDHLEDYLVALDEEVDFR